MYSDDGCVQVKRQIVEQLQPVMEASGSVACSRVYIKSAAAAMFFNYKPHAHYIAEALCSEAVDQHASGQPKPDMQPGKQHAFLVILDASVMPHVQLL